MKILIEDTPSDFLIGQQDDRLMALSSCCREKVRYFGNWYCGSCKMFLDNSPEIGYPEGIRSEFRLNVTETWTIESWISRWTWLEETSIQVEVDGE